MFPHDGRAAGEHNKNSGEGGFRGGAQKEMEFGGGMYGGCPFRRRLNSRTICFLASTLRLWTSEVESRDLLEETSRVTLLWYGPTNLASRSFGGDLALGLLVAFLVWTSELLREIPRNIAATSTPPGIRCNVDLGSVATPPHPSSSPSQRRFEII
ncbi:hypothetical protein LWI29_016630 [Acer saccharum]|uniref:Uncharacterized protein n=1 Tax=Acer saccharum TaxID=4024 RepID=A0AA39SA35_ACESA|nr:hypothetical protein LWI29_016630 [Acer saccharum]